MKNTAALENSTAHRRGRHPVAIALALAALVLASAVTGRGGTAAAAPLAQPVWLCLPGAPDNPCDQDGAGSPELPGLPFTVGHPRSAARTNLDSTVVGPFGGSRVDPLRPPDRPPVDCFYVYPTVDLVPNPWPQTGSRPPRPSDVEANTTWGQVGRLIGGCRMFVPVYRQLSLPGLLGKKAGLTSYALGEQDIEQAWDDYWNHHNIDPATGRRRGVVLLGHSQGSADLQTLIQHRIDGNPAATNQLVAAVLLGANTIVPLGRDRGDGDPAATFQRLPVCHRSGRRAAVPTGCVVAFSTYNEPPGALPPPDATFSRADAAHEVACVNPAALLAGADPGADTAAAAEFATTALSPASRRRGYRTGLVRYPDRLTAQCRAGRDAAGTAHWLQVDGDDRLAPRTDVFGMGLHIEDWQLTQDDVDALVDAQIRTWLAAHPG